MEDILFHMPLMLSSVSRMPNTRGHIDDFQNHIKKEVLLTSANELLYVLRRIQELENIKPITDICLFKNDIEPMWEDPQNIEGGKWIVKFKRGIGVEQRLFEKLLLRMAVAPFETMEVNGVMVSIRKNHIILSLWTMYCPSKEEEAKQEEEIRSNLDLRNMMKIDFKGNDESMRDNSSFRHTVKDAAPGYVEK